MSYVIRCSVVGGRTGNRHSTVKTEQGGIKYYATREAAQTDATRYSRSMNEGPGPAMFDYWVEAEPIPTPKEAA